MDINETLRRIRSLVLRADKGEDVGVELAEHVRALDHWMSSGGFAPYDWQAAAIRFAVSNKATEGA